MKSLLFFIILIKLISCTSRSEKINTVKNEKNVVSTKISDTLTILEQKAVLKVIHTFQNGNKDSIAALVNYPLKRYEPFDDIENATQFVAHFSEMFDSTLIATISNSELDQWSEVGWRGVMLNNGIVWIDYDWKIRSFNYETPFEKNMYKQYIDQQKSMIHSSLKQFEDTYFTFETKRNIIRIDKLKNNTLRYASWKVGKNQSEKPDLILLNGVWTPDGSGGNYHISFSINEFTYIVYRNILGEETTLDCTIEVLKNEKEILRQHGNIIKKF